VKDYGMDGGIYAGPVVICTREKLWELRGEKKEVVKGKMFEVIFNTVKRMDTLLMQGNLYGYLAHVSTLYRNNEETYYSLKRNLANILPIFSDYRVDYLDFTVYRSDKFRNVFVADYVRLLVDTTGEVWFSDDQVRYFGISRDGIIKEVGNRNRFFEAEFYSKSLGQSKKFYVYLPPSYDTEIRKRYPVLYLLHGLGGSGGLWKYGNIFSILDSLINIGKIVEMIVIMPDADSSFYVNSFDRGKMYESYIVNDLIQHIDANFRTIPYRETRGIAGVSVGGFGAMYLGLKYPDRFISIGSIMGAMEIDFEMVRDMTDIHGGDRYYWESIQPTEIALEINPDDFKDANIFLYIGDKDEFRWSNEKMSKILSEKGIKHIFKVYPGKHERDFWISHFIESIISHSNTFYRSKYVKLREKLNLSEG
jgi:enterochelin esterase-like enzyme